MKKLIIVLLSVFMCLSLAACSMGWDDAEIISASIAFNETTQKYYLEITYDDGTITMIQTDGIEEVKGDSGEKGEDGNGIAEITTSNNGKETIVTISFTDEDAEDVSFSVPDGVSIEGVRIFPEDETHTSSYIVFNFSGGKQSEEILLPKGKDGTGIEEVNYTENKDANGVVSGGELYFKFTDGTEKTFDVSAASGIKSITQVTDPSGQSYILNIEYTDGRPDSTFIFDKPAEPATWLNGSRAPSSSDGKDGDYWFNTDSSNKAIFLKKNGTWIKLFSFVDEDTSYLVTFKANGGYVRTQGTQTSSEISYIVNHGNYLSSAEGSPSVPIPTRSGYKFIGWYTKLIAEEGEEYTLARFTDLTPICSNLTLYAWWEPIN